MTTTDNIMGMVGLGIGVAFGLATLKAIRNLNPTQRTETEELLKKSQKFGTSGFVVIVRDINLNKARSILKRSGFVITNEFRTSEERLTNVYFREKIK